MDTAADDSSARYGSRMRRFSLLLALATAALGGHGGGLLRRSRCCGSSSRRGTRCGRWRTRQPRSGGSRSRSESVTPRLSGSVLRGGRRARDAAGGRSSLPEAAQRRRLPLSGRRTVLPLHQRGRASSAGRSQTFEQRWRTVDLRAAKARKRTPYDVLTIASLVEREAASAGRAESSIAAVDLQPARARHAARDRRDDPLRARHRRDAPDQAARTSGAARPTTRTASRACRRRRSRTRVSPRCGRRRSLPPSTTSTTSASRTACITSSRRTSRSSARRRASTATGC